MTEWNGSIDMLLFIAEILQLAVFCAILAEITFSVWRIFKSRNEKGGKND